MYDDHPPGGNFARVLAVCLHMQSSWEHICKAASDVYSFSCDLWIYFWACSTAKSPCGLQSILYSWPDFCLLLLDLTEKTKINKNTPVFVQVQFSTAIFCHGKFTRTQEIEQKAGFWADHSRAWTKSRPLSWSLKSLNNKPNSEIYWRGLMWFSWKGQSCLWIIES